MDKAEEMKVKVVYRRTADYRVLPVSGAYGGPSPQGMLVCHIYAEYNTTPESGEVVIRPDHPPKEDLKQSETITRELLVGLHMTPQIAKVLGEWLQRNGSQMIEKIQKSQEQAGGEANE